MRFRIKKYIGSYVPQVFKEGEGWGNIGIPGYASIAFSTLEDAKKACVKYKSYEESKIVEEFEL